jgi:ribosomal protein L40E
MSSTKKTDPGDKAPANPSLKPVFLGIGGLSLVALLGFTFTIGAGRPSGPGFFLASAVAALGAVAFLMFQSARSLVATGSAAEEREAQAAVGRRRKELEREYQLLKRALKELELDYAMGKLSDQDYSDIRTRYRERAVRILRQLDQGESYRAQIERDLAARREARGPKKGPEKAPEKVHDKAPERDRDKDREKDIVQKKADAGSAATPKPEAGAQPVAAARPEKNSCAGCGASNDNDAVFCKKCGARLSS